MPAACNRSIVASRSFAANAVVAGLGGIVSVAEAARRLEGLRDRWLNPPALAEAELRKRTLTNHYNARPARLDHARRAPGRRD